MCKAPFPIFILLTVSLFYSQAQTKIIIHENTTQHDNKKKEKERTKTRANKAGMKDAPSTFLGASESAIKLNISPIFRGDYCLSFEKKITKELSAEVTGGVVYRDQMFDDIGDFLNYKPFNMVPVRRKYEIGPSVKLATRYYFSADDEEIAGPYVGLEGMFRRYNTTVVPNYSSPIPVKEYNDHREIRTFLGWQGSEWSDFAFYDLSIGVGYRMHVRNYMGYTDNNYYYEEMMKGQKNYVVFLLNFKIGFLLDY
ncbi:MAG: hypothetical protein K0S33_4191 [Bacteroidetes bacterium]|jgi:hypothetical protein|nr:hypothetical protein [Bacteroidota bacterium]